MILRRAIVVVVALLLIVQVIRNAAVEALATIHPNAAERLWADHPSVEISVGLTDIGRAARNRKSVAPRTFAMIYEAAVKAPLSSEPFLVRGVQAQTSGDIEASKRAFLAAQWRDPRSMPASYFLANYYFRAGDPLKGLEQAALLTRLSPQGVDTVAPFIAAYAQNRSNWTKIRALFRSQEELEYAVLAVLAHDPRNADAILALADSGHRKPNSAWLQTLLQSLVKGGDYGRARAIWVAVGGGNPGSDLVYDSSFSAPVPPPPFNWSLNSSGVGLAERQSGKRLHVIFYGNEDGTLASELLLLPSATYRLQMQIVGAAVHGESLRWSVRCDRSGEPIASIGIEEVAARGWLFQVPANCPAQWLELSGRSGDIAQQSEATITGLTLIRAGADA